MLGLGRLRVGWVKCRIREHVLLISEQHKWSENSAWYKDASHRAGILVCSPDLNIGGFLETDAGFVWVEVARVRVYSCYFSPNDPIEIFETQILILEESLKAPGTQNDSAKTSFANISKKPGS